MGTKKGQVRKTARRAYEPKKSADDIAFERFLREPKKTRLSKKRGKKGIFTFTSDWRGSVGPNYYPSGSYLTGPELFRKPYKKGGKK